MELSRLIRDVPDFPKKGIVFKDITTLLQKPRAFRQAVNLMMKKYRQLKIDKVVAVEARGYILGGAIAYRLNAGFVPARKPGKLPSQTLREEYSLEYGSNALEIHVDGIAAGDRVLIVDDLLATGGTARAALRLVERMGGTVVGIEFLIELEFLKGREKLAGYPVSSYIRF